MDISLADELAEVRREMRLRERVYPRWVADGTLAAAVAERRLAALLAVAQRLAALLAAEAEEQGVLF